MRQSILLIDDTPGILRILSDILKDSYDIIIAKTGQDGMELAKVQKPDLIILDVLMPGLSGLDVLKMLRDDEETANIPVVFITGRTTNEDEEEGYALGIMDYIKKPFVRTVVKRRIDFNMQYIAMKQQLAQQRQEIE